MRYKGYVSEEVPAAKKMVMWYCQECVKDAKKQNSMIKQENKQLTAEHKPLRPEVSCTGQFPLCVKCARSCIKTGRCPKQHVMCNRVMPKNMLDDLAESLPPRV